MPWNMLWPEFLKKRLCRYLLQHYLGHFFKEKISLEQLTIDIYNGTGCVKNLNLDCESLNEQLSSSSAAVPIEIVSGFVGYISVYIPWHDLFNDYCKLTIKNVQITIRIKQAASEPANKSAGGKKSSSSSSSSKRPANLSGDYGAGAFGAQHYDEGDDEEDEANFVDTESSMFSSMFVDSIMQTSMNIAQECLYDRDPLSGRPRRRRSRNSNNNNNSQQYQDSSYDNSMDNEEYEEDEQDETEKRSFFDNDDFNRNASSGVANKANNLLGLEAFASTIDSILSRIKINLEQVQIRFESLEKNNSECRFANMQYSSLLSSRLSNGIALELRIKSIKYFDLDSAIAASSSSTTTTSSKTATTSNTSSTAKTSDDRTKSTDTNNLDNNQQQATSDNSSTTNASLVRNTTKSFNIEGLTVYFDEFVIRDELGQTDANSGANIIQTNIQALTTSTIDNDKDIFVSSDNSLNNESFGTTSNDSFRRESLDKHSLSFQQPQDEADPFNYTLDPDYYLYTNPVICVTFSGIQSIKLTIANMRPTDLIIEAANAAEDSSGIGGNGSDKAKLDEKLNNQTDVRKKPLLEMTSQFGSIKCLLCPKQIHLLNEMFTKLNDYIEMAKKKAKAKKNRLRKKKLFQNNEKPIRGYDSARLESGMNNLNLRSGQIDDLNFKDILNAEDTSTLDTESSMFFSMMSESIMCNDQNESEKNAYDQSNPKFNENENRSWNDDEKRLNFTRKLKETIDELRNDVIVSTSDHGSSSIDGKRKHKDYNLFQTFKMQFRMFSLTVLHHDPPSVSSSKRLLVDRMKPISDSYFNYVSTIDASGSNPSTGYSIEKEIISKYHKACAFNDHFLVLLKPININLIQKINQHKINMTSFSKNPNSYKLFRNAFGDDKHQNFANIKYSLNDITVTIGYIEINEYLIANNEEDDKTKASTGSSSSSSTSNSSSSRVNKNKKINAAFDAASKISLLSFVNESSGGQEASSADRKTGLDSAGLEKPCLKLQFVIYDSLDNFTSKGIINDYVKYCNYNSKHNANSYTNLTYELLNGRFEDISIQLNQSLVCELDISIVDRIYYLLNDVTKFSRNKQKAAENYSQSTTNQTDSTTSGVKNVQVNCSQVVKVAIRFPIADLRRDPTTNFLSSLKKMQSETQSPEQASKKQPPTTARSSEAESASTFANQHHQTGQQFLSLRPVTMTAFRQLREQILTLHLFDFDFQTILNPPSFLTSPALSDKFLSDNLFLTLACSQINAFYQYTKSDRPIHFALLQQGQYMPRSLICLLKISLGQTDKKTKSSLDECVNDEQLDSLEHNFKVKYGKSMRAFNKPTTIEEEEDDEVESSSSREDSQTDNEENDANNGDQDSDTADEDENLYGPFSRIHSLISSEKNRRIVNAANKQEMELFTNQSKNNSADTIIINVPVLKLLIIDQKFLNDIYNCFLNDLCMWIPIKVPPLEYTSCISTNSKVENHGLNYLINMANFDTDFITTRMNLISCEDYEHDYAINPLENVEFKMCKSMIDEDKFDNEKERKSKRKSKKAKKHANVSSSNEKSSGPTNMLCFIIDIEQAHLKAFVNCNSETLLAKLNLPSQANSKKYGEFDVKTKSFHVCVALSEKTKPLYPNKLGANKDMIKSEMIINNINIDEVYKIQKQYISIFSEKLNIAHQTHQLNSFKYPTNMSAFEKFFESNTLRELVSSTNDILNQLNHNLFNSASAFGTTASSNISENDNSDEYSMSTGSFASRPTNADVSFKSANSGGQFQISVPAVSFGIRAKFDMKSNTKNLLLALNFNSLCLNHLFTSNQDFWIFQLIDLFNLVDIDIVGYEVPIVLTELHLNVANSCVLYEPNYLSTKALLAFKSLHWSSNVTAEATSTLLVFNIEDIYLFLNKPANKSQKNFLSNSLMSSKINLRKDFVCVANSTLFEIRLLINDDQMSNEQNQSKIQKALSNLPLLDIKIRSNLINLRTCVDSAFALIELINYIVSDGDLFMIGATPSVISNETESNAASAATAASVPINVDTMIGDQQKPKSDSNQSVLSSSPLNTNFIKHSSSHSLSQAINIAAASSNSIPIRSLDHAAKLSEPSFSLNSSPSLMNQQIFYSPVKVSSSLQENSHLTAHLQHKHSDNSLPSPSLSYKYSDQMNTTNEFSSADSLITDMLKEAINTNAQSRYDVMTQSIYGANSFDMIRNESIDRSKKNYEDVEPKPTTAYLSKNLVESTSSNKTPVNDDDDNEENFKDASTNSFQNSSDDEEKSNNESDYENDSDELLVASIHRNRMKQEKKSSESKKLSRALKNLSDHSTDNEHDEEAFQFEKPFGDFSPQSNRNLNDLGSVSFKNNDTVNFNMSNRSGSNQPSTEKTNRRLYFRPSTLFEEENDFDNSRDQDDDDEVDKQLLREFDIIEIIPGFGEPPKNNQEFEIKILKNKSSNIKNKASLNYNIVNNTSQSPIVIKDDHFKKPLTKIDVLKAPDNYPTPFNVYCVQEISLHWSLYGGSDFSDAKSNMSMVAHNPLSSKINRTVSSPLISGTSSLSSNFDSFGSQKPIAEKFPINSPQKQQQTTTAKSKANNASPSSVRFSSIKSTSTINFSKEKSISKKAGGRITNMYDKNALNWLARGGKSRNLDISMDIALYKVKAKIDQYTDLTATDDASNTLLLNETNKIGEGGENKDGESKKETHPYLYRVALAIGDIEIKDRLVTSPFNMFLFRYESEHRPKHTNSNMFFLKFLCSKSMDSQGLIECDIKLSIQPLRFNIDQNAMTFLVEFFQNMSQDDLNEFKTGLVPPEILYAATSAADDTMRPTMSTAATAAAASSKPTLNFQQQPQQQQQSQQQQQQQAQALPNGSPNIYIRNFIFSPDLHICFDFSGKYDNRPSNKMDTITKILMVVVQLSNTEIKLKRICTRRGYLGGEKLLHALVKEWVDDIRHNQMKNLIKGWGIFNSLIQFFEGFTYLVWYPIQQYRKDGRLLCGIQKGSAAFSTSTVLATIELTNRMFLVTKNVAQFFYDLVTPHRANSLHHQNLNMLNYTESNALVESILNGVAANNRNIKIRRHPTDIREGLTNAYYVFYEGINDTAANLLEEINQGAENKGIPGAIGGALRQLPSTALAPIVLTAEATCSVLSGIRNQLKPDEKRDDDQKWKNIALN